MNGIEFIQQVALWAIPLIYAITMHEVAHGWVASKLGDNSAFMLGRVSLNPFKHIDPVGTIIVPLVLLFLGGVLFGWAKPVPVNEHALKNPKKDIVLVALAGPLANLLMAFIWALCLKFSLYLQDIGFEYYMIIYSMSQIGIIINIVIGLFNLIPIPPLDGSKIMYSVLPKRYKYFYNKLEPFGFIIIFALLVSGVLSDVLGPLIKIMYQLIYDIAFNL
jgi:Zn-dependent protease